VRALALVALVCACSDAVVAPDAAVAGPPDASFPDANVVRFPDANVVGPADDANFVGSPDADVVAPDASIAPDAASPAANVLHVAPAGDDRAAGTTAAPLRTIQEGLRRAQSGEIVRARAGTYAELVSFPRSGVTLESATGERVILDGTGLGRGEPEPALVSVRDVSHVVVRGLELINITGAGGNFPAGIWVRGSSSDIRIEGNIVRSIRAENGGDDTGAHGIAVYGTATTPSEDIVIERNQVFDLTLGHSEAVVINGNVRRFALRDNTVHDVDNIAFDIIGFESDVCPRCTQADTIADDVNRARDGVISGNTAYSMTTFGNPSYGSERSAACYYVDGGADIVIERNIAHDCDLGVELASEHAGTSTKRVTVRSNFLYRNLVTGIATGGYDPGNGPGGGSAEDCAIVNNTISDSSRNGWADTGLLLQNRNVRNVYANNIVVASAGGSAMASGGARNSANVFDGNIVFGGIVDGITGTHRTADPQLVDPASGDLHLRSTSPARGTGVGAPSGTLDFDSEPRLQGALDVGADEVP